jgi:hypothetical protein
MLDCGCWSCDCPRLEDDCWSLPDGTDLERCSLPLDGGTGMSSLGSSTDPLVGCSTGSSAGTLDTPDESTVVDTFDVCLGGELVLPTMKRCDTMR